MPFVRRWLLNKPNSLPLWLPQYQALGLAWEVLASLLMGRGLLWGLLVLALLAVRHYTPLEELPKG